MYAIETILTVSYLLNLFISVALGLLLLMIKTLPQLEELMYHRAKVFLAVATIINQYTLQQVIPAVEVVSVCDSPAGNNNLQLKDRLESLMAREFLYLRSGVVIEDLADRLDIHKRALSSFIHTTYGMHFNNWINHLRVEYAKNYRDSRSCISELLQSDKPYLPRKRSYI